MKNKIKFIKIKSFTILELVIVMALLGFLALTATAVLNVGDSIWRTEMGMVSLQEQTRLAIDGMVRELRAASDDTVEIYDSGTEELPGDKQGDEIRFCMLGACLVDRTKEIKYSLDSNEIIRKHSTTSDKKLARNIDSIRFEKDEGSNIVKITISATTTAKGRDLFFSLTEKVLIRNQ